MCFGPVLSGLCLKKEEKIKLQSLIVEHQLGDELGGVWSMHGKFLGIVGQDPSDSLSNQLHVDNLTSSSFAFIHLRYIL
jgi:hypothetical protein